MNINDYIKELRELATNAGVTDATEMHEVLTLSLFKMLNSEATASNFNKYQLEHFNEDEKTLRIMGENQFHAFIEKDNSIVILEDNFYRDERFIKSVKSDAVKEGELEFFNLVKESESFEAFSKKYTELAVTKSHRHTLYNTNFDLTLINANRIFLEIEAGVVTRPSLLIEPFGELNMSYKGLEFGELSVKNINDKLSYLEEQRGLFDVMSSIDGVNYTSFSKFKDDYMNNKLDPDMFLSKMLSSDNPTECIKAVFSGEWFETYKASTLRSVKKSLMSPSVSDLYEMHPIVNELVDAMYTKYPYFTVDENNVAEVKVHIEKRGITETQIEKNKNKYLDELNIFTLNPVSNDKQRSYDKTHTRVYMTSPFGVLMDIGGRHNYNISEKLSILYLDNIQMNTKLNDDNEMLCLNRFMKMCVENKIICAYDGENISSRAREFIENYKGVVGFDRSLQHDMDLDNARYYLIMIKNLKSSYEDILAVHKEFPNISRDLENDEVTELLQNKLKEKNKLTL